jgi:3D (Asp-Asp-Asp) domain-containing protein
VVRGTRTWGLLLAAVLSGVFGFGVARVSGAESVSYRLRVDAVAYHLPGKTASGLPVRKGVVAVDPDLIPLGTRLFVPGYGRAIAADVGVAIKGRIIDLWMPTEEQARSWGRRTVVITVYR